MDLSRSFTGGGYPDENSIQQQDLQITQVNQDYQDPNQQYYQDPNQQYYQDPNQIQQNYHDPNMQGMGGLTDIHGNIQSLANLNENYEMDDYNNPKNYDLYYQSLYQMYPQMSDYVKKQVEFDKNIVENKPQQYNMPCVLFNMGILDPQTQENNLYDPDFISNYYRMNMQQGLNQGQNQSNNEQQEGGTEDSFDPYNIRGDMGDINKIKNEENSTKTLSQPSQPRQENVNINPLTNQPIDYSKYDFNKYIEHMYANQGSKRGGRNQRGRGGRNNNEREQQPQSYKINYDKDEVNDDVTRFYESFYKEEFEHQNQNQSHPHHIQNENLNYNNNMNYMENNNSGFNKQNERTEKGDKSDKTEKGEKANHEFAKPMSMPKRKSRFDEQGPDNSKNSNTGSSDNGNRSNNVEPKTDDINIQPVNENNYYSK